MSLPAWLDLATILDAVSTPNPNTCTICLPRFNSFPLYCCMNGTVRPHLLALRRSQATSPLTELTRKICQHRYEENGVLQKKTRIPRHSTPHLELSAVMSCLKYQQICAIHVLSLRNIRTDAAQPWYRKRSTSCLLARLLGHCSFSAT
jgi:hypothetical protein